MSVLLVDDDLNILRAITSYLTQTVEGLRVASAASGAAALAHLERQDVDIVVSDFRMPGMDGLEFLERAQKLVPRARRVMMTAYPDLSLALAAINAQGVVKFLTKPVDPDELVRILTAIADEVRATRMREAATASSMGRVA